MNSLRSFAPEALACLIVAALAGCTPGDGAKELADGRAAYDSGNLAKAEKLLLESEELNETNVDTQVSLALLYLRKGDLNLAADHIDRASETAGGDTDVRLLDAEIAWHRKDYDKAARLFGLVADDATLEPSVRAAGWTGRGIVDMTCDRYDLARVAFLRALRLDGRYAPARYHLGYLYRYAPFAYPDAALEQFEIFVRLDEEADARVQKTQRAVIPALKTAITQATEDIPGVANRNSAKSAEALSKAETAAKKGNSKAALAAYREALAADPLAYPAALGLARTLLKTDTSAEGQRKALESYRRACKLRPGAVATFVEAGRLAEKLGQLAQAREIYSRAVAANPASFDALDGLIRAFRRTNEKRIASAYQAYRDVLAKATQR